MKPRSEIVCLIAVTAFLAGCTAQPGYQGSDRSILVNYRGRVLTGDLPGRIRVQSVAAASEMALRRRGYSVSCSPKTEDYTRVEGVPPKGGLLERVIIRARQTPQQTRVEIVAEPLGDQTLSRSLMDEVLANLGL